MALAALSEDEQRILFVQLCNVLEPHLAVYLSSVSRELWELTQAQRQQLKVDHEAVAALCHKAGIPGCKELRRATGVKWANKDLTAADLALLGTLGSVLPALEWLHLIDNSTAAGPDGVQRLAAGLGAGALPAVTNLAIHGMHMGDAGASAFAAALGRGALPQLKALRLFNAAIGDAGLVALAAALRRMPALEALSLEDNPFGDEGLAALVAPLPLPAGAPPPPLTGVLTKLRVLDLEYTQVSDAGCATLAAALNSGALPALARLDLDGIPASAAAIAAVREALERCRAQRAFLCAAQVVAARAKRIAGFAVELFSCFQIRPFLTPHFPRSSSPNPVGPSHALAPYAAAGGGPGDRRARPRARGDDGGGRRQQLPAPVRARRRRRDGRARRARGGRPQP